MKILVVADVLGKKNNGTTMAAYNLIESLQKRGHDVRVLCGDSDKNNVAGYFVCPKIDFGIFNKYVEKNGVAPAKADIKIIEKALEGVDLVHCMLPFSVANKTAKIANEKHIPITCGFHIQAENVTSHVKAMKLTNLNPPIYKTFYRLLYRYADAIHYPTKFIKDDFERAVGPTNGHVISNGVKNIFTKKVVEKPIELKDKFCILYTGRYSREKSQKLLIKAVKYSKYKDKIQLILAGDGPLRKQIENQTKKFSNKPILGIHSQDELIKLINYCDLYVHCAYAELESIACLEAISCGLVPVINNSKRSAPRYFALDKNNLFKRNNPKDLAKKIDYWIEHPFEKEKRSNEYVEFTKQFEYEHCMDRMNEMMLEAVKIRKYKTINNLNNRVIAYHDEYNDDFACTSLAPKKLDDDFKYIHNNLSWKVSSRFVYKFIAKPICYSYAKLSSNVKIVNKNVLKKIKKEGYFLYGNHTNLLDGVIPQTCITNKKRTYVICSTDAFSIKGISNLIMMLGSLPVPTTLENSEKFLEAIETRISQNSVITIFPEKHIWPYARVSRNFSDVSFVYPVKLNAPIVAFATTYRQTKKKLKYYSKPKMTITLSEPIYPNPNLSQKENMIYLRDQAHDFIKNVVENAPMVDYINYIDINELNKI